MKDYKIISITAILNFIVAILKLITGITFSFSTLIADSVQSFIDFFTDILSLIVNKIGKRRANKTYPFGYGQVYYLANMFTGIFLFLIGIFVVYQFFFFSKSLEPSYYVLLILLIILVLKWIVIYILKKYGNKSKNELLIESSKESKADFISTCVVILVLIISFFEQYIPSFINVDKIGCLGMAIYIFYTSFVIIVTNIDGLLTNDEENFDIKNEITQNLLKFKEIEKSQIKVIKMSTYYNVFLRLKIAGNTTITNYIKLEKRIKKSLKKSNKLIRFIDIDPM